VYQTVVAAALWHHLALRIVLAMLPAVHFFGATIYLQRKVRRLREEREHIERRLRMAWRFPFN
jgi:hypothetical protein